MEFNKENTYFNIGCSYDMLNPHMSSKVLKILNDKFGIVREYNKCCRIEPKLEEKSTLINICAGCSENLANYDDVEIITLWEVLNSIEDLKLPDHSGMTVTIHDACSYRKKPHIYKIVRNLLGKMNIEIVEAELNSEKTVCCGRSMAGKVPLEKIYEQQKKRGSQMPLQDVVTYCSFCMKSMANAGKTSHHLLNLILDEKTEVGQLDLMKNGAELQKYKEENQRMSN